MLESEDEIMARDKSAQAIAEAAYSAGYTAGLRRAAKMADENVGASGLMVAAVLSERLRSEGTNHA